MSGIKYHEIIEGNLKATKDTSDFGGPNQWNLCVKDVNGYWEIEQRGQEIKYELRIGDEVKVNHTKTRGKTFIVVEIKRKKVIVEDVANRYARYNVALQLVERAK